MTVIPTMIVVRRRLDGDGDFFFSTGGFGGAGGAGSQDGVHVGSSPVSGVFAVVQLGQQ
jgi:hypothetical protein